MFFFFFFNDTATTEIYTLSLHDALPISLHTSLRLPAAERLRGRPAPWRPGRRLRQRQPDRKSTRLNSSHSQISYAVFCLKKKKIKHQRPTSPIQSSLHRSRRHQFTLKRV